MHSYFELLLISFSIASSSVARASDPGAGDGFTPYVKSNYFDTQADAGELLADFVNGLESRSVGGVDLHELFERQMQNGALSNLQFFTGSLGGIKAPAIVQSNDQQRPFSVMGDTFPDYMTAAGRSCSVQNNDCCDVSIARAP
jgi:hypothetical protein